MQEKAKHSIPVHGWRNRMHHHLGLIWRFSHCAETTSSVSELAAAKVKHNFHAAAHAHTHRAPCCCTLHPERSNMSCTLLQHAQVLCVSWNMHSAVRNVATLAIQMSEHCNPHVATHSHYVSWFVACPSQIEDARKACIPQLRGKQCKLCCPSQLHTIGSRSRKNKIIDFTCTTANQYQLFAGINFEWKYICNNAKLARCFSPACFFCFQYEWTYCYWCKHVQIWRT